MLGQAIDIFGFRVENFKLFYKLFYHFPVRHGCRDLLIKRLDIHDRCGHLPRDLKADPPIGLSLCLLDIRLLDVNTGI